MVLGQLQNAFAHTSPKGAEVTGIGLQSDIRKPVDYRVERLLKKGQDLSFISSILIGSYDVIFRLFVQNGYHVPNGFRSLLQISVDETDILAICVLKSGIQGRFLAKIPGEGNNLYGAFLRVMKLFQVVEGGILAAVIHIDDLIVVAAAIKGRDHRILKCSYIFGFVVAGDNERQFHGHQLTILDFLHYMLFLPHRQEIREIISYSKLTEWEKCDNLSTIIASMGSFSFDSIQRVSGWCEGIWNG